MTHSTFCYSTSSCGVNTFNMDVMKKHMEQWHVMALETVIHIVLPRLFRAHHMKLLSSASSFLHVREFSTILRPTAHSYTDSFVVHKFISFDVSICLLGLDALRVFGWQM